MHTSATSLDAPSSRFFTPSESSATLHIPDAGSGWGLLMQSGVNIACTVGIPLKEMLHAEFGLTPEQLRRIDVMLLEGKPVDEPESTLVPGGARLALAAGLPGIAGLAMKSGSAVRGLRPGITHGEGVQAATPQPACAGHIELALFSLALPLLAGHFLARGVLLPVAVLSRYVRLAPEGTCVFNGNALSIEELGQRLSGLSGDQGVNVTAIFHP